MCASSFFVSVRSESEKKAEKDQLFVVTLNRRKQRFICFDDNLSEVKLGEEINLKLKNKS